MDIFKYYLSLTVDAINDAISRGIKRISAKRVRRYHNIPPSNKSKINFIWRGLEYLEKARIITLCNERDIGKPSQYYLPKEKLNLEKIMDTQTRRPIIGLFDVDGKIPNLALMKLSAYYKKLGYKPEKYSPLFHSKYHLVYASKLFRYPHKNDNYIRNEMIKGGPGFDIHKKLPKEIDHIYPDYSLYNCNYALGYITKGCSRNCPWCIVSEMEGNIYKFADLEEFCKDQEEVRLLDNNILAYENHMKELEKLRDTKKRIDFTQGLDIRLITKENAKILREIKRWKGLRYKFAFDDPGLKKVIKNKLDLLFTSGFTPGILQFYVLIGFNTTLKQDLMRVKFLAAKGIDIFAMPFNKLDPYQRHFTRWVNRHFYRKCSFQEYISNKNLILNVNTITENVSTNCQYNREGEIRID